MKNFFLLIIFAFSTEIAISQCNITSYGNGSSDTVDICLGDSVTLTSVGGCSIIYLYNDFNNGTPGTGWSSYSQPMFNNPCAPHSPDGTIYLWMGSSSTAPRDITSVNLNVSMGGYIEFQMRYPIQSDVSPCEGPDEFDEGIAIQYSVDSGSTWNTIEYYAPNGNILSYIPTVSTPGSSGSTPFTVWNARTVAIPTLAMTTATMFRWAQTASTSEVYDHWGLDNVRIFVPSSSTSYWWSHGPTGQNPPIVHPTQNTTYTVYLSDSIDTVQSSLVVIVHPVPTSDFTVSSPVCAGSPAVITYTGTASSTATYAWSFDGGMIISGTGIGPYQLQWNTPGVYNLTLGVLENFCISELTSNIVNVIDCNSIENIDTDILNLYTSPTGNLIINSKKLSNNMVARILNINGQVLLQQGIVQPITEINLQSLAQGMYFIYIEGEGSTVGKFVKK